MWRRTAMAASFVLLSAGLGGGTYVYLRPVEVFVTPESSSADVKVFGLGTVEARVVSKLGFKIAGIVVELRADQGDRVARGTVLARLDSREQEARVAKAQASIRQAEANFAKAQASGAKAQANLTNAQQVYGRRSALAQRGTVSVETAETAQASLDVARAELSLASSDIEVARAAIDDARTGRQYEGAVLDLHSLAVPYDAVVTTRHKELGTIANPGEAVFTVVDPKSVWALAYVDEARAGEIRVGQPAEVVLRSMPARPLPARVVRIDVESDRVSEERRVYVVCERCPEEFHLGEQAEITITTGRLENAVLVPAAAVEDMRAGRGFVWTVEDGRLARRQVSFGHHLLDGRLEITEGLPAGARVVARPGRDFHAGRAVVAKEAGR